MIGYRRWGWLLLVASLSCICIATIFPFEFSIPEGLSWQFVIEEFNFGSSVKDYLQNILLFIPLGISLGIVLTPKQPKVWIILGSLFTSAILSTTIELTQFLLPTRVSNLTDIIYNSLGGTLGGVLYYWRIHIIQFFSGILTGNPHKLSLKSLLIAIVSYCSLVILGIWVLLISVNLSNWDEDYYLAIGNEVTGDRPWNGYIQSLYICDRSLNQQEVTKVFDYPDSFFSQLPSLVTSLEFHDYRNLDQDQSQQLPDLTWQKTLSLSAIDNSSDNLAKNIGNKKHLNQTVLFSQERWLKTEEPAVSLNSKLKDTDEFSISLILATNKINQFGPARIISLSDGIYAQNMIIGQQRSDFNFRIRTPITGSNATQPEFIIPNIFSDQSFHHILITFSKKKLRFYIDQPENQYFFEFTPATSFLIYFPWEKRPWIINLQDFDLLKYQQLFYTIIIIPLAILIIILIYYLLIKYLLFK
ncbi:VanZ family protein [Pleurocapsa sp. PCC 7319]|uniref:VanZ family protein n=1 Tax=Pleurocapsa sp. PCC 7319 TaxID=118161 RepID=UPI0003491FE4|nr:VanZ family protein [Pleurocapsa sp. PCC 7319]